MARPKRKVFSEDKIAQLHRDIENDAQLLNQIAWGFVDCRLDRRDAPVPLKSANLNEPTRTSLIKFPKAIQTEAHFS
jgi:hypothetical protein